MMDPVHVAMLAIVAVCLLATIVLKVELALFVFTAMLGFPDLALPLMDAVNLRVEDLILVILAGRLFLVGGPRCTPGQRRIMAVQLCFAGACLASAVLGRDANPDSYYFYLLTRLVGCLLIIVVIPNLVRSSRELRFLIAGLMLGGLALMAQMAQRLIATPGARIANFQELKGAVTPATWGPNALGQAAVLLVFGAAVGSFIFSRSRGSGGFWLALGTTFALMPVAVFTRASGISIFLAFGLFAILTRRGLLVLWLLLLGLGGFAVSTQWMPSRIVEGATHVDLSTGEGFSGRYNRWAISLDTIGRRPILGYGFGNELAALTQNSGVGLSHNSYMSAWLELGLIGPILMLMVVFRYVSVSSALLAIPATRVCGAAVLALMLELTIESATNSSFYWDKWPTIALSLALAAIGVVEREYSPAHARYAPIEENLKPRANLAFTQRLHGKGIPGT
jgi:O-antigen ligase